MAENGGSGDVEAGENVAWLRSVKGSPGEVIDYEIAMLRYCFKHLFPAAPHDVELRNVYLESYLVHYRALLEFFAHPLDRVKKSDLTMRRPSEWAHRALSASEVGSITTMAEPLHATWFKAISQQLSHCTKPRYQAKQAWPISAMHAELERVICAFERVGAL